MDKGEFVELKNNEFPPVIRISDAVVHDFAFWLKTAQNLQPSTISNYRIYVRQFLKWSRGRASRELILKYIDKLKQEGRSPLVIKETVYAFRRFFRDYLKLPHLVEDIKPPPLPRVLKFERLPTRWELLKAFESLKDVRSKAIFLFTFTTGLRRGEILKLRPEDIIWEYNAVVPKHFTKTKRAGISFFTWQAREWLEKYLEERGDEEGRLFRISDSNWDRIWIKIFERTGIRVTPQVLRKTFSTICQLAGIPTSIVNIWQGRAPQSVIERFYTSATLPQLYKVYKRVEPYLILDPEYIKKYKLEEFPNVVNIS